MDERAAGSMSGAVSAPEPAADENAGNLPSTSRGREGQSAANASNQDQEEEEAVRSSDDQIAHTLRALKEQIAGLERQVSSSKGSTEIPTTQQQQHTAPPPRLSDEARQYRRREKYLYESRKEWEKQPYGGIEMSLDPRVFPPGINLADYGPWWHHWSARSSLPTRQDYIRPNPFTLPEDDETPDIDGGEERDLPKDDFDHHIDYGNRRDWLRKTFEWDMDRLWLAEETQMRRNRRTEEKKLKREQEKKKKADALQVTARDRQNASVDVTELNRVEWPDFKAIAASAALHPHVIDVLIGDPIIDEVDTTRRWLRDLLFHGKPTAAKVATQTTAAHAAQSPPLPQGHAQLPERIRIHSAPLLAILNTILGGRQLMGSDGARVVFFRPFKMLAYCESALREWCQTLEAKRAEIASEEKTPEQKPGVSSSSTGHDLADPALSSEAGGQAEISGHPQKESSDEEPHVTEEQKGEAVKEDSSKTEKLPTDPGALDAPAQKGEEDTKEAGNDNKQGEKEDKGDKEVEDITQSDTALIHMKCLLNFIDTEMGSRRNRLVEPGCRRVFFSDLWHLFRPGVEVIGSDGKQAYRVVNVTTAKHGLRAEDDVWFDGPRYSRNRGKNDDGSDEEDEDRKAGDLSLRCVYIDFDGQHVGPVLKDFEFKKYQGEKEVSSLEVYPLRYHPVAEEEYEISTDGEPQQDADWLRKKLIHRGTMFLDVVGVKHMYYAGPTLDVREEVESQVVVDFETALSAEESKDVIERPALEVLANREWPVNKNDENTLECSTCCKDEVVFHDALIDLKQTKAYIDGLLPKSGTQQAPSVAIVPRLLRNLRAIGSVNGYSVSDSELLIMSYRVFGFVLRSRKWATLDLTYLSDIQPSGHFDTHPADSQSFTADGGEGKERAESSVKSLNAFDRLVLPEGHKPMVTSLIAQHFRDKESKRSHNEQVDIVRGKGKGLIMLLHGAPGVGKTSTAEGVAELFKKPLFQITCGDLGTTAKEVEKALETNFALASRWGCILLLDEADVFLAERTKEDFKRNGLVAVFLRVMEYYSGILFLTTNRVGDFDEAFTSRIHISLHYPELNMENTLDIFQMNLQLIKERFQRQGRSIKIDMLGVDRFATKHFTEQPKARWNGRQIRNACQTALALAEFEAQGSSHEAILRPGAVVNLTVDHFDTVRKAYVEFTAYMTDLYGTSAARRAKEGRLRAIWLDENDRVVGTGGNGDFLRAVQTPLRGGSPGRGPQPSRYPPSHPSPQQQQQQPGANRHSYPYQQHQHQQHYHQQPHHQTSRSAPRSQAYHQQPHREASQPHRQGQDPMDPQQRPVGAVDHDRQASHAYSPAHQGDFLQPEASGYGSYQYVEPDVHSTTEGGDGLPQTPPSMQRPRSQEARRHAPQEGDMGADDYQWRG